MNDQIGRRRVSLRTLCGNLLVAALVCACRGEKLTFSDPQAVLGPIAILSGWKVTDTVAARPLQPLIVEVRDSTSRRAVGVTVRFRSIVGADPGSQPLVLVAPLFQQIYSSLASDVTDSAGRAETLVSYGYLAGTARLEISVPELGVVDTLSFSITPASPARLSIAPADTSIPAGGSYQLRATVTDQYYNPIAGLTPSFSATGVTVSPTGRVTVPNATTRGRITVSYAALSDTAGVSVVPVFPMIIVRGGKVERISSDGSGSTVIAATPYAQLSPSSVPATSSVVFYEGYPGSDAKLWVAQPGGMPQLLISGATTADAWPRLSPDGVWVYFVRNLTTLWRVKLDGTGLDSLGSFTPLINNVQGFDSAPTISPDGRSVAIEDRTGIQIIDVATKATRTLPVTCGFPRYSPDGAFFACASQTDVSIVGTDGTGQRVVAQFQDDNGPDMYSGVDWSPDGKWLVMMPRMMWPAILVEVSTGTKIPLTGLGGQYSQPSFVR